MKGLSSENGQKLDRVIQMLDEIVGVGTSSLRKFPTEHYELIVFTFINYLERFTYSLENINLLLRHFKNKPNVETSIGLTIRAGLLDFMTITYLSTYQADIKSKEDTVGKDTFDKQFDGLIADQIHNTIKYLKTTRDHGLISQQEYNTALENSWHSYNFLFTQKEVDYQTPEKKIISQEFKTPRQLFTRIHSHPLTKKFSRVYDLYTYYGKYEHFGIMTHFMQRQGIDKDFETMLGAMKYLVIGMGSTFVFLSYPLNKLQAEKEQLLKLQHEFEKL